MAKKRREELKADALRTVAKKKARTRAKIESRNEGEEKRFANLRKKQ